MCAFVSVFYVQLHCKKKSPSGTSGTMIMQELRYVPVHVCRCSSKLQAGGVSCVHEVMHDLSWSVLPRNRALTEYDWVLDLITQRSGENHGGESKPQEKNKRHIKSRRRQRKRPGPSLRPPHTVTWSHTEGATRVPQTKVTL